METSGAVRWIVALFRFILFCCIGLLIYRMFMMHMDRPPTDIALADKSLRLGNLAEGRNYLDRYIDTHPHDPTAYQLVLAICEKYPHSASDILLDYAQRAIQDCSNASDEDRALLYMELANAYTQQHPPANQKARAAALQALNLNPEDPEILNGAGYILAIASNDTDDLKRAQLLVGKALTKLQHSFSLTDNDNLHLLFSMAEDSYGWILCRQALLGPSSQAHELYANAVEMLLQATSDMPQNTPSVSARTVYYHLGAAYCGLGRYDLAKHAIQVALFYDPQYEEALQEQKKIDAALAKTNVSSEAASALHSNPQLSNPAPALTPVSLPSGK